MRTRIYEIIARPKRGDNASHLYDLFIVLVSVLSLVPVVFHPNNVSEGAQRILEIIDIVAVYILCFDYLLNWMTFDIAQDKRGKWTEFLKYPFTLTAIVNLLSILPTLNLLPSEFLFLRVLRIIRLFRYSRHLTIIINVFIRERKTLGSILILALAFVFTIALLMFTFEPTTFDNFVDALYWSTITLTTIGFGDITPESDLGYILTSISSIIGIFILALPAGIMTGGFLQQLRRQEEEGDDYYSTGFFEGIDASKFCLTPAKIKAYFRNNPKLRLYLCYIFGGIVLNYLLCAIFSEIGQPLWLDTTGTALVACALDPSAGVIVSFVNNLIIAVYQDSPQNILYFSESALVALVYGYLFKQMKTGELPYRNAGKTLLLIVIVQSIISVLLAFFLNDGIFTTPFENGYRDVFMSLGFDVFSSSFFAMLIDRAIDAVAVFGIVVLILKAMSSKNFVGRKWLEEYCPAEHQVQNDSKAHNHKPQQSKATKTGILSCEDEALVLNRDGLRKIASSMRDQAHKAEDPQEKLQCLSAAETILLLAHFDIKDENEFKNLFEEKMNDFH